VDVWLAVPKVLWIRNCTQWPTLSGGQSGSLWPLARSVIIPEREPLSVICQQLIGYWEIETMTQTSSVKHLWV
jgi:hypothetical protein